MKCAARLRSLLHSAKYPSETYQSHIGCSRVQDAYTLRCIPQVHGVTWDTLQFVRGILQTELNSGTDNPMIFSRDRQILSGGNFHGEYVAKALDFLAIGIHEIGSMSERRIERLVNPALSELPAFLVREGGLNSGFMIAHCTAASLVSEDKVRMKDTYLSPIVYKFPSGSVLYSSSACSTVCYHFFQVLCHPSSIDSLSTSAAKEDHVSMGGFGARKALKVVENVEKVCMT
jgi:histidine ammonia-lyase